MVLKPTQFLLYLSWSLKIIELCAQVCRWKSEWQEDKQMDFHMVCLPNGLLPRWNTGFLTARCTRESKQVPTVTSLCISHIRDQAPRGEIINTREWRPSRLVSALDQMDLESNSSSAVTFLQWALGKPVNPSDSEVQRETV